MKKANQTATILIKIMLGAYIALALIIAGFNYGYADQAPPAIASLINWFWYFYENWIKTILIIFCGLLTLKVIGSSGRTIMRKRNLLGFACFALVVHIAGPYLTGNSEFYLFSMALPWNSIPLQLLLPESPFHADHAAALGTYAITASIAFFFLITLFVFAGTLLWGRRLQCSTLCLFNGFASEVFAPAFPLTGKKKKVTPGKLKIFSFLRWLFLAAAFFFTGYWLLVLAGMPPNLGPALIHNLEIYLYLGGELMVTMLLWVFFTGRGYCYYCPLGTLLALLGKVAGQKIITDRAECIECERCDHTCPMSIDIKSGAAKKKPVSSMRCTGCGHCVDTCPTQTLAYSTGFLEKRRTGDGS